MNITLKQYFPIDGKWGSYDTKTKESTGLIKYLITGEADLISALYGINIQRFNVIDYAFSSDANVNILSIRSNLKFIILNFNHF